MMKKLILILMCVVTVSLAADVSVHLSRTTVGINESFSIEFSSDQKIIEQPDFNPLKEHFDILSTSQSSSTSMMNGDVKQKFSWILELVPKQEGKMLIPSISFGKSHSAPQMIEVTHAEDTRHDKSIFIETEISPKNGVYAQSQVIYTVRLYRSVNLLQATLSDVKVNDPNAMIEKLGNDVEYEQFQKNGIRYVVLERKYAVYPQQEGELIFSPIVFEGKVVTGGNSVFNIHSQYKRVASDQVRVDVKPIPPPFQKNNWLAAYDVKLSEEWSIDPPRMTEGEPITWTLTITADGCMGNQIPQIPFQLPDEIKQYEDKPLIENRMNRDRNVGIRQIKIALIASKSGELTIPEVIVKWWDLNNDQIREAKLPARTIHVAGAEVAMLNRVQEQPVQIMADLDPTPSLPWWAWGLIGLNSIWIFGLVYRIVKKWNIRFSKPDFFKGVKSHLKSACQSNDAKQAESHLLLWAGLTFPQMKFRSINGIKGFVDSEMQEAIDDLYQCLYGKKQNWRGDSLWQAIKAFKAPKKSKKKNKQGDKILKSLY